MIADNRFFSFDKTTDKLSPLEHESQVYKECVKGKKLFIRVVSCDFRKTLAGYDNKKSIPIHIATMKNNFPAFTILHFRTCKYLWNTVIHPVFSVYIDSTFAEKETDDFEAIFYHELGHIANGNFNKAISEIKVMTDKWNQAFSEKEKNRIFDEYKIHRYSGNDNHTTENEIRADEYAYIHSGKYLDLERVFVAAKGFLKETQNREVCFSSENARIVAQKKYMGKGA